MEINATACLVYRDGKSLSSGYERLEIYVKFRERRKLFKTKLSKNLVSTYQVLNPQYSFRPLDSYSEYYSECEKYLNVERIREVAEDMIRKHFNNKNNETFKDNKLKEMQNKVGKLGKVEIKVKIN